jgi:catechol 2,3-dioxygenase-like lactoylglutathione lyase family enzyme
MNCDPTFATALFAIMQSLPPRLNLVVLRSPDVERAVEFYRQMGLPFTRHSHGSGPIHFASEVNGMVFELYPLAPKSAPTTGARIGFLVDNVDDVVAKLSKFGAEIAKAPEDSEWGRRAVVRDFDGHTIELITVSLDIPIK